MVIETWMLTPLSTDAPGQFDITGSTDQIHISGTSLCIAAKNPPMAMSVARR